MNYLHDDVFDMNTNNTASAAIKKWTGTNQYYFFLHPDQLEELKTIKWSTKLSTDVWDEPKEEGPFIIKSLW